MEGKHDTYWQLQTVRSKNRTDDIITPLSVAKMMIDICSLQPGESVLDPSLGFGVFYDSFPSFTRKFWCEIKKNRNFYEFPYMVDCVCGNPPYSQWSAWLKKTVNICNRFCYIMGIMNLTPKRMDLIEKSGFVLAHMRLISIVPWPGNSWIVYFVRKTVIPISPKVDWLRERVFYNPDEEAYFDKFKIAIKKNPLTNNESKKNV